MNQVNVKGQFIGVPSVRVKLVHTERLRHHHRNIYGRTFDLFDGHCDGQNWLHTHFARQRNVVAWCEWTVTTQKS